MIVTNVTLACLSCVFCKCSFACGLTFHPVYVCVCVCWMWHTWCDRIRMWRWVGSYFWLNHFTYFNAHFAIKGTKVFNFWCWLMFVAGWSTDFHCEPGYPGDTGEPGPRGSDGHKGPKGIKGDLWMFVYISWFQNMAFHITLELQLVPSQFVLSVITKYSLAVTLTHMHLRLYSCSNSIWQLGGQ